MRKNIECRHVHGSIYRTGPENVAVDFKLAGPSLQGGLERAKTDHYQLRWLGRFPFDQCECLQDAARLLLLAESTDIPDTSSFFRDSELASNFQPHSGMPHELHRVYSAI